LPLYIAFTAQVVPETILANELAVFSQSGNLPVFQVGRGEIDTAGYVIFRTVPNFVDLKPQPYYRMIVEVELLRSVFFLPTGEDVLLMLVNKGGVPGSHKRLGRFGPMVVIKNRQTTGCAGEIAATRA